MTAPSDTSRDPKSRPPWQPRFGIGGMLLVMLVFGFMASLGYYLARALSGDAVSHIAFFFLTLAAPVLLVVAVSAGRAFYEWRQRKNRSR